MATPKEVLFQTLEDLGAEDFKVFKWFLGQKEILDGSPSIPVSRLESADRIQTVDQILKVYGLNCVTVTKTVLTKMNQNQLVQELSKFPFKPEEIAAQCQCRLQAKLQEKFVEFCERITKTRSIKPFHEIYTELYITRTETGDVNTQHEVRHIESKSRTHLGPETVITCNDIFKGQTLKREPIRTVLTKGVAGIGKTVLTQKFSLDWAEGRANQDVQLLFPFTFRELNVLRDRQFSLVGLLQHFFSESAGLCSFEQLQVLFIFDGLDECRLPLDFTKTQVLTEATESVSVDVLLVNLIRGTLLPSARLWITTRPAAANQIPAEYISMVTEVRGFADPQKEQYFRKRFKDVQQATAVISHIRTSRSLYIMCHIPVFCWIIATVIENILKNNEVQELPKSLTNLFIHFLVVQLKRKNVKYDEKTEAASAWSPENKKMIESLGKLAFEQLQKGNLIFYESDLSECGLDTAAASVYSGVFTEIFQDEGGLYQDQVYCFVHLSIQEFLAALHVHQTFINSGINLLVEGQSWWAEVLGKSPSLYQSAVNQALQSPNGHLDLFLRFLLGLSLESNQSLLSGLLQRSSRQSQNNQETAKYITKKIKKSVSAEKSLNLFHCLNELNERSLVEQIQVSLRSGRLDSEQLSPAQWSALVFILLSSDTDLEVFDLKKYSASEEALLRLLPVVNASNKALLANCNLSEKSCAALASVVSSQSSSLRELDLSNNHLQDSGVKSLCLGLKSPHCRLETLELSCCKLSEETGALLSSVLCSESSLTELDLSKNDLQDSGLELLAAGLRCQNCRLETLRLSCCNLTERSVEFLCGVLSSEGSRLKELDLAHNYIRDKGVMLLCGELQKPNCSLQTLSLGSCSLSASSWEALSSALGSEACRLKELDLCNNNLKDAGLRRVCVGLSLNSALESLRLNGCGLSQSSCGPLSSVLSSSRLKHMDLSNNDLLDSGLELLCSGLKSALCRLETLRLPGCKLSESSCGPLSSVLVLESLNLRDLDLSNNDLRDSGLKSLASALESLHCSLQKLRLENCSLSEVSCGPLSSVFSSQSASLRELDLSNNDLRDSGVKSLCLGLESPHCRLDTLRLSGCLVSEEGCVSLASALNSNPLCLRELDLSFNHPGDSGAEQLGRLQRDSRCRLESLRTDSSGPHRLKPGLRKYFFELRPDLNTPHPNLKLSNEGRTVTCVDEEQPYPEHPDRFDFWVQVLCSDALIGRCYFELQSKGLVKMAVSYKGIGRKGNSVDCRFGANRRSWCLFCSNVYYSVWHNNRQLVRSQCQQVSDRVGVFVDSEAGSLTFYSVLFDKLSLLHSFSAAFTEPLFAGVRFWLLSPGSSVTILPKQ